MARNEQQCKECQGQDFLEHVKEVFGRDSIPMNRGSTEIKLGIGANYANGGPRRLGVVWAKEKHVELKVLRSRVLPESSESSTI